MSNTKQDENITKAADEAKPVKQEEKTAAKAPAKKTEEKPADKGKPAESAVAKETEKKEAVTSAKQSATADKKNQSKPAAKEEVKSEVKDAVKEEATEKSLSAYPFNVTLTHPVATYRGPSLSFVGKHFGGKITVTGESGDFYKVTFVRSEFGLTTSYMLRQEVEKCRS